MKSKPTLCCSIIDGGSDRNQIDEKIIPLRHKVLRPGRPIESCFFTDDRSEGAFHAIGMIDNQVIAIASFHKDKFAFFPCQNPYRLRGMAVDNQWQNLRLGEQLLNFCFSELQKKNCDLLWCNAREKAFSFYSRVGFIAHGELFDIPPVGLHKVLYKRLS